MWLKCREKNGTYKNVRVIFVVNLFDRKKYSGNVITLIGQNRIGSLFFCSHNLMEYTLTHIIIIFNEP